MSKGKNLKYCHTCRKRLPMRFFLPNPKQKDGLDVHCNRCSEEKMGQTRISTRVLRKRLTPQLHQEKKETKEPKEELPQEQRSHEDYMKWRFLKTRLPLHTFSRTCTRCGFEGHGEYFGWARKYSTSLNSNCRNCQREKAAEYRKKPGYRERAKKHREGYRKTHKGKMANLRYYHRNKGKIKARAATGYAMRNGKIPHPTTRKCRACGDPAEEYHHRNYEELLNVVPVCVVCHRAAHRKYEPRAIEEKRGEYMSEGLPLWD